MSVARIERFLFLFIDLAIVVAIVSDTFITKCQVKKYVDSFNFPLVILASVMSVNLLVLTYIV